MLSSKLFSLSFLFIACSLGVAASPFADKSNSTSSDNTTDNNNAPPSNSTPTTPPSSSTSTDKSMPTSSSLPPDSSTLPHYNTTWTSYNITDNAGLFCKNFDNITETAVALHNMTADLCGRTIQLTYGNANATGKLWDNCDDCPPFGLVLSKKLFYHFVEPEVRSIYGTWELVESLDGGR